MSASDPRELSQIGEVAESLGVSPRTIKYYEELGLVAPEERSPGGFRLYKKADVERLERVLRLKGMGFSLAAIREFLAVRDAAREAASREEILAETAEHLRARGREVAARIEKVRQDLLSAEALRQELEHDIALCEKRMRELRKNTP